MPLHDHCQPAVFNDVRHSEGSFDVLKTEPGQNPTLYRRKSVKNIVKPEKATEQIHENAWKQLNNL